MSSIEICGLEKFSISDLQRIQIEINRELSRRIPKNPISIIKEWEDKNKDRLVKYKFIDQEQPKGVICTISVFLNSKEMEVFSSFVGYDSSRKNTTKMAKRRAALTAIQSCIFLSELRKSPLISNVTIENYDETSIVDHIKLLLQENSKMVGNRNKAKITLEMFEYLNRDECILFMKNRPNFAEMMLKKMKEIQGEFERYECIKDMKHVFEKHCNDLIEKMKENGVKL